MVTIKIFFLEMASDLFQITKLIYNLRIGEMWVYASRIYSDN